MIPTRAQAGVTWLYVVKVRRRPARPVQAWATMTTSLIREAGPVGGSCAARPRPTSAEVKPRA